MNCNLIILTFIITGLWDVVLRFMSLNYNSLPKFFQIDFIEYLIPYFNQHTLLAAALIAGFVGATTQPIIISIMPFPKSLFNIKYVISALYGFIMKWSKLFPYLEKYYYNKLGLFRSMYCDGVSGIVVNSTILVIYYIISKIK